MKCCICGPVRNCGLFLPQVFQNIEKIGAIFDDYKIMIYYDKSTDNTLDILKEYKKLNNRLEFFVGNKPVSIYRTHRIAHARNFCLKYVKKNFDIAEYPYFIMMDFDDVNAKNVRPEILKKYLTREDWDGLSFNTSPKYYDIWGLSIYPYCFSYNHFENNSIHNYSTIQDYITNKLNKLKPDELLQCISSFNGFSIYRTNKFLNTYYDGRVRVNLIPPHFLLAHEKAAGSKIVYPDLNHVKAYAEDCEHRAFHVQAINKNNAKIMITNDVLFV